MPGKPTLTSLLDNPAIQAAVLPFATALVLAFLLARSRSLALAVLAGLMVVIGLTIGYSFELPLSSVKKLLLATVLLSAIGLVLDAAGLAWKRGVLAGLALGAGLAALWVVQRVLQQAEGAAATMLALGAFAFAAITSASVLEAGRTSSLRAAVVSACLGWGAGVLALLGASALLAQIGLALGSAAAAVAMVQMLRGRESPLGASLAVPVAVGAALIPVLASATGELRWFALIPLPLAAVVGMTVPTGALRKTWQVALAVGFATLVPVAATVAIAWFAAPRASPAG